MSKTITTTTTTTTTIESNSSLSPTHTANVILHHPVFPSLIATQCVTVGDGHRHFKTVSSQPSTFTNEDIKKKLTEGEQSTIIGGGGGSGIDSNPFNSSQQQQQQQHNTNNNGIHSSSSSSLLLPVGDE